MSNITPESEPFKSREQRRNRDPRNWTNRRPTRAELEALIDEDPRSGLAKRASEELWLREREANQR